MENSVSQLVTPISHAIGCATLILLIVSCGGGGGSDDAPNPPPQPITYSIQVNSTTVGDAASLRMFVGISVNWQFSASPTSTNNVSYSIRPTSTGLRVDSATGSAAPGTSINTVLRHKCSAVGSATISATLNVGGASQTIEGSVECTERVLLEFYQGPRIAGIQLDRNESGWTRTIDRVVYAEVEDEEGMLQDLQLRLGVNRKTFVTVVSEHGEEEDLDAELSFSGSSETITVDFVNSTTLPPDESRNRPNYLTRLVFDVDGDNLRNVGDMQIQVNSPTVTGGVANTSLVELGNNSVPHFNLVIVPIRAAHGSYTASDLDVYLNPVRDTLPIGDLSYRVRAPFDMRNTAWDFESDPQDTPLHDLFDLWIEESNREEFYHGIFTENEESNFCGIAFIGLKVGMTQESTTRCSNNTMAHEIGHNLSLMHAPGCGAEDRDPDPNFPYSDGSIGTESGWFMLARRSVGREGITTVRHFDLMSYCSDTFVSQYSYGRAFDYWTVEGTVASVTKSDIEPIEASIDALEGKSWAITGQVTKNGGWSVSRMTKVDREPHVFWNRLTDYKLSLQHIPSGLILHEEPIYPGEIAHSKEDQKLWGTRIPYFDVDPLLLLITDTGGNVLLSEPLVVDPQGR